MKKYFLVLLLPASQFAIAQNIVNAVMVGDKGITDNAKTAKYLIVVKAWGDTAFERLEYNFTGPMKRRLTYKDPFLKILNGNFTNFSPAGLLQVRTTI